MKTIETILEYKLSSEEISNLLNCGIMNGCGGKGGQNFDKILKDNLALIKGFDIKKQNLLFYDIRLICYEHDIDFRFKKGFFLSNFKFAKKVYKLLIFAKKKWVNKKQAFSIALIIFILLNRYGKKFYNS